MTEKGKINSKFPLQRGLPRALLGTGWGAACEEESCCSSTWRGASEGGSGIRSGCLLESFFGRCLWPSIENFVEDPGHARRTFSLAALGLLSVSIKWAGGGDCDKESVSIEIIFFATWLRRWVVGWMSILVPRFMLFFFYPQTCIWPLHVSSSFFFFCAFQFPTAWSFKHHVPPVNEIINHESRQSSKIESEGIKLEQDDTS